MAIKWASKLFGLGGNLAFSLPQNFFFFLITMPVSDYSTPTRSDLYRFPMFNASALNSSQSPEALDLNSNSNTDTQTFTTPEPFETHSPPLPFTHPKLSALFVDQVAQQYHITNVTQLERMHVFFGVSFFLFNSCVG